MIQQIILEKTLNQQEQEKILQWQGVRHIWEEIPVYREDQLVAKGASIFLSLTDELGPDEFGIQRKNKAIQISGGTISGLCYGLEALFKEPLKTNYRCQPRLAERSLLLDMGRKFYTKEWIFQLITMMASYRYNTLQLHFSENEGFRIESNTFPEIVSSQALSKSEIKEIIDFAEKNLITVIPELDSPGHLKQLLTYHPEWQLLRKGEPDEWLDGRALDILNSEAVSGIKKLLSEYFELFSESQYFHIGADEFIDFDTFDDYPQLQKVAKEKYGKQATGMEIFIEYTNDLIQFVKQAGFIPRVWNDGFYRKSQLSAVELSKDVQVTYWTRWHPLMAEVNDFLARGYQVINFNDNYFYFVLGEAAGYRYPTKEKIVDEWTVYDFPQKQVVSDQELDQVLGMSLAIWSDQPEALTEEEVLTKIKGPLQGATEKIWVKKEWGKAIC